MNRSHFLSKGTAVLRVVLQTKSSCEMNEKRELEREAQMKPWAFTLETALR